MDTPATAVSVGAHFSAGSRHSRYVERPQDLRLIRHAPNELNVRLCLNSGQVFLWHEIGAGQWLVRRCGHLLYLEACPEGLLWSAWPPIHQDDVERFLGLGAPLQLLFRAWVEQYPLFREVVSTCRGLRVLHQTPEEALVTFICSSCNNVRRMRLMLDRLSQTVGEDSLCPWAPGARLFPTLDRIRYLSEDDLRALGFGYRSSYLHQASLLCSDTGSCWTCGETSDVRRNLLDLPGVGPKVADCVLLFGFGDVDAVPIDRHVHRFLQRSLGWANRSQTLTPRQYDRLAAAFRGIISTWPGWAQQYAFVFERNTVRLDDGSEG